MGGRRSSKVAGEDALEAVVANLHTGGLDQWVTLCWKGAATEFGGHLSD